MIQRQTMDWLKENWFKAGVLIAILIIAYSFYQVLVLKPEREAKREESAKIEAQLAEEQRKTKLKEDLSSCIATTEGNYSSNWFRECKSRGEISNKCVDINELSFSDYLDKYGLTPDKYNEQRVLSNTGDHSKDFLTGAFDYIKRKNYECSCRLPLTIADRLNDVLKDGKDICHKQYPQN